MDSLPALALVNKEFQIHAEEKLYSSVIVKTLKDKGVGALRTLQYSEAKAAYVQSLNVEFHWRPQARDNDVMETLLHVLRVVKNVKCLVIRTRKDLRTPTFIDTLNDLLSCVHP